VFDCEELLESSILSIRNVVDHICIVYQTTSNYGEPCNPHLESFLASLKEEGLVDSLIFFETKFEYSTAQRERIVSKQARAEELGGSVAQIGHQFFNEVPFSRESYLFFFIDLFIYLFNFYFFS
jgi:hypothetical protein